MHDWAVTVERLGGRMHEDLKSGIGPRPVLDFLRAATEAKLQPLLESVAQGRLQGAGRIGMRVGRVLDQHTVGRHFLVEIQDQRLELHRDRETILAETQLDGIHVIRTSVAPERLATDQVVRAYKQLSRVERAFRTWKGLEIQVRPIRRWSSERVGAHILLCMLAHYVHWHLQRAWAPCSSATSTTRSRTTSWPGRSAPRRPGTRPPPRSCRTAARCTVFPPCCAPGDRLPQPGGAQETA